jgi:hypothetical protein
MSPSLHSAMRLEFEAIRERTALNASIFTASTGVGSLSRPRDAARRTALVRPLARDVVAAKRGRRL